MAYSPSFRSQFVVKRTYNRPLNEEGTVFEIFSETVDRVISHQRWLWETAKGKLIGEDLCPLEGEEESELEELRQLMLNREATVSGRTLWLGGVNISKKYQATQFNCSFAQIRTVHDVVDAYHNLLLGVGVGFEPITGILNGFAQPVEIQVVRSTRKDRGDENNREQHYKDQGKRYWHLYVGDSGIAWAKAAGKIIAMKKPVDVVVLDFTEVRPGGKPLRNFGWISSGDEQISIAFKAIAEILNNKATQLLTRIDILDIMNWLGTSLSSRRSAEIALMPADDPEAEEFASAKKDYWKNGNIQRAQSNNSLLFYHKPTKRELRGVFSQMLDAGGSEPGIINGVAARKRAPWFRGVNPCCVSGETNITIIENDIIKNISVERLVSEYKNSLSNFEVMSYDITSNEVTRDYIDYADITTVDATVIKIELNSSNNLTLTPDHKIYTKNKGWVEAINLCDSDILISLDVNNKTVEDRIVNIVSVSSENVYDVSIRNNQNFFANGLLVHNCEILLGDKSYCNLVTIDLGKFNGRETELHRAFWIMGRANYRQTCVDLRDGVLQETWHELNQFLRLTGMGCAGIVMWEHHKSPKHIKVLANHARAAVNSMAKDLNLPISQAVNTTKPDGTVGKMMDTTEGIHKPLSKYIFNNIMISKSSPLLQVAIDAGYRNFDHPFDSTSSIVTLPVCFENVDFEQVEINGKILDVNLETAIDQLERYKMWMNNYADHNISITVSYSPDEVEEIVAWLHTNWDHFVGVSFLLRVDPTKTAKDLGYAYLPQQPVSKEDYYEYVTTLKEVNLDEVFISSLEELDQECSTGVCPTR